MRFIRKFDRFILIPLLIVLISFGIMFLFKRNWIDGIFLVVISFLVQRIRYSLYKNNTLDQLSTNTHPYEENNKISKLEVYNLKKAFIKITFLSSFVFLFLSIYHGMVWWQVLIGSIALLFLSPILMGIILIFTVILKKR